MGTYFLDVINFIGHYVIKGIFISVLVIIVSRKLFKGKINIQNAVNIIACILVGYAMLSLLYYLIYFILHWHGDTYTTAFWARATGTYWFAYWLMLVSNIIMPLLLLFKKLRLKIYVVFMLSVIVNIGWLFESLVIHVTGIHRNYSPGLSVFLPYNQEFITILNGLLLGVGVMVAGNLRFKTAPEL